MRSLPSTSSHFRRRVAAAFSAVAASAALFVVAAAPASADIDHSHDPFGRVSSVQVAADGLLMTGWALDPDALTSNATVVPLIDGYGIGMDVPTSLPNAKTQAKYHTGPTPGFSVSIPVNNAEPHTVCLSVRNVGTGLSRVLKCVVTPLGTKLTVAQRLAHNPAGVIEHFRVGKSTMHVSGWASDPDWVNRRLVVVLYVNGVSTATVFSKTYPAPRPTGAGRHSAFDITVPVSAGAHLGCLWVVNVGMGKGNSFLGCRTGDTRGPAGTDPVTTPALNTKVVREAKRHIGERYVWGAVGPHKFDCSGLVMYSYHKYGFTTPRISEDQFLGARLIPASRAVPGDLVFYHDNVGDVFHVGIYLSPGKTVAAIDEAEGVNYQTIWDPTTATYGSFTHT